MNELLALFRTMNIPEDKIREIAEAAGTNPMAAMAALQEYITPEIMQQMLGLMMANPGLLDSLAAEAGIPDDEMNGIKDRLGSIRDTDAEGKA